jgi:hypothetical protein
VPIAPASRVASGSCSKAAPRIAGIASKNEHSAAGCAFTLTHIAADMVEPERDTRGTLLALSCRDTPKNGHPRLP